MELNLLNILLVLVVAWFGGVVAKRLGYPMVLGELVAGVVFGPPLLGLLGQDDVTLLLGQVGVLVMMFYIGLELNSADIKRASIGGFMAAIGGFIIPLIACGGTIYLLGFGWMPALFVGVAAGVTSLATKSRILSELDLFNTRIAHVMMAGALIADTLCLVVFAALLGFASTGDVGLGPIALVALKAAVFFAGAWVVGHWVVPRVLNTAPFKTLDRGGRFLAGMVFALALAEVAHLAGLHGILGAFIAGLILDESVMGRRAMGELRKRTEEISVGFLAPFFFVTAGFAVDLSVLVTHAPLVIGVVVLASIGKIVGTAGFYAASGRPWREGLAIGTGMNGRGAVEIVVAQIGLSVGAIDSVVFSLLVFMAIATTATVPIMLKISVNWLRSRDELVIVEPIKNDDIDASNVTEKPDVGWTLPAPELFDDRFDSGNAGSPA